MKKLIICLAIASATFIAGIKIDFFYRSEERVLVERIREFHRACVEKDIEHLRRNLPSNLTITHFDGHTFGKDQLIRNIGARPGSVEIESFYFNNSHAEINRDWAIVTGESISNARFSDGHVVEHRSDSIYLFEKRNDEWRLVLIRQSRS